MKTASGRTVTGHAPQGGQASDQASERAPGRHRPPRPDTSHTKTPKRGQTGFESQTRSTGTNLATAPDGTTPTLTDRFEAFRGGSGLLKGRVQEAEKPGRLQGKRATKRLSQIT